MFEKFFQRVVSFLLKSNIYIALGASFIAYITLFLLDLPFNWLILATPFFGFMVVYNLNRLTDVGEDAINVPERLPFINRYTKPLLAISALLYLYFLSNVFFISKSAFLITILQTVTGIIYSLFRLKKCFLFKNIVVAITWGMTVLFTGLYYNIASPFLLLIFVIVTLEFFINNTIFDIKDIEGDRACNIKTVPGTIGIKNTLIMGYLVNTISILLLILGLAVGILTERAIVLLLFLFYAYVYLYMEGKLNRNTYYGLLVDGEFMFAAFIVFMYGVFYG